eukprot:3837196-Pleurochrysis_carterae.AAC.1
MARTSLIKQGHDGADFPVQKTLLCLFEKHAMALQLCSPRQLPGTESQHGGRTANAIFPNSIHTAYADGMHHCLHWPSFLRPAGPFPF